MKLHYAACRIMRVSPRGYLSWRTRPISQRARTDMAGLAHIREQYSLSLGSYGRPRMTMELKEAGLDVGERRVGRLMKRNGIRPVRTRRHKVTTDSHHRLGVVANWLDGDFVAAAPNQKWAGDITYVWTSEGWLYLAVILDLPLHHLMSKLGARFDLNSMVHFAHWITPQTSPKRWNTYFLIARAPADQRLQSDGYETVSAEWVAPEKAIAMADRGERDLLFSTRANLHLLAQSSSADEAIAAARLRPRFEVHPQAERKPDGIRVFISEKAGYPVSQGWVKANLGMRSV